jgi:hypothetical protein
VVVGPGQSVKNLHRCNLRNQQISDKPFGAPSGPRHASHEQVTAGLPKKFFMGSMILKRSSISRSRINPVSEEMVAPWKSIMIDRLKSGRIASFWLSPLLSTLATPEMLFYSPYIR